MKKIIVGLIMALVFPLIAVLGTSSPASATDWINCTNESSAITWNSGDIAGYARVRVYWTTCHSSTSFLVVRNNAHGVRLTLDAGNCATVNRIGYDVSNIEGFDLGKKYIDCVENQTVSRYYDINTAGYTYESKGWYWNVYQDNNFPIFDNPWTGAGHGTWGE